MRIVRTVMRIVELGLRDRFFWQVLLIWQSTTSYAPGSGVVSTTAGRLPQSWIHNVWSDQIMAISRIEINGVVFEVEGNNVSFRNGVVYVDGVAVASGLSGNVHVIWHGDLASLDADGSVDCQNIYGSVNAGGSVRCSDIAGHVNAGGSVKVKTPGGFGGSATASASGHSGSVSASASRGIRIGHGDITCGSVNAGGSVHVRSSRSGRYGSINAGGSIHLDS